MDALRRIAIAEKIKSSAADIPLFHRIFLASIKQYGRVFEFAMMGIYNLVSGHYFKDVLMAPGMVLKGRLSLLPPRGGNIRGVKEIFAKVRELEAKQG